MTDVLAAVAALLDKISAALAATGSLTLAAGALVLVAAVAAGQRRRTQEAVLLKVLGASFGQIVGAGDHRVPAVFQHDQHRSRGYAVRRRSSAGAAVRSAQ